ncbi:coproporphyrinogen III oxidase-like Fe-S oxidoreductase [Bradyrhizobium sp. LB7.2]
MLPDAEIAVEIDPRTLTEPIADGLGYSGVNRASLRVQSFDPVVECAINRLQIFEQTATCVERLRRAGVGRPNFDLNCGLPLQSVESCLETVAKCIEFRPDRLSVFGYAHIPYFKKHQCKIATNLCAAIHFDAHPARPPLSSATEPLRVCRRPFGLSYAAMASCSSMA